MALTLTNQRPAVLDPVHLVPIAGHYDPVTAIRKAVVEPLFEPLSPGGTVSLVDQKGDPWDADDVSQLLMLTLGDDVDARAEDELKPLLEQGLVAYDASTPLLVNSTYAVQAARSLKPMLPHPGTQALYTAASDVIPSAKKLLAGTGDEAEFFASLAYTYSPTTLGFWFQTEAAFDEFKAWLALQVQTLGPALPSATVSLLGKFGQLRLNALTEGLALRADVNDQNDEYSFARVIVHLLMKYQQHQRSQHQATGTHVTSGVLPFHMGEVFIPRTIVLVNLEIHARANPRKVDNEWKLINATLASGVRVISTAALSKLTALPRAAAKAAAAAANAASNRMNQVGRSASIRFRRRPPSKVDLYNGVLRALSRMKEVNRSRNAFKKASKSFLKASRRDPDDYNRPGKVISTHYLPDLHVYLDCSGSISESNYQDAVIMLIKLAKKMRVDLYFSSFSTDLSQEVLLKTANRSVKQVWEDFRRMPKVTGGTAYHQIWAYIQASPRRRERFSLIVTDFEWYPPSMVLEHPKNLYYAPIASSDWNQIVYWARHYVRGMRHIEPAIAQRMIGVTV